MSTAAPLPQSSTAISPRVATAGPLPHFIPRRLRVLLDRLRAAAWGPRREVALAIAPAAPTADDDWRPGRAQLETLKPGWRFSNPANSFRRSWGRLTLPKEERERGLFIDLPAEMTLWEGDRPLAGIDHVHRYALLPGATTELWIDIGWWAAADGAFGGAWSAVWNRETWEAAHDLEALLMLAELLADEAGWREPARDGMGQHAPIVACDPLLRRLLRRLDEVADAVDARGLGAAPAALSALRRDLPADPDPWRVAIIGNSHLDLVWLWPEAVTRRKAVHTFATAIGLMERDPHYTFTMSQPWLLRQVERVAPTLADAIKRRIAEGRWEVTGGTFIEPDCNIPCGEALARCLAVGQRHTIALRGAPARAAWLPDTFGFPHALPQLFAAAGIEGLFTCKMHWSTITKLPYHSFLWRGPDGTEIMAHQSTTGYGCLGNSDWNRRRLRDYQQADVHDEMPIATGAGDGGGGPSHDMLARVERGGALSRIPPGRWTRVEDWFDRLARVRDRLPVWDDEMYLEYHRGVLTARSAIKRAYRSAERALQLREAAHAALGLPALPDAEWERVLFTQFHDAVTGTSLVQVCDAILADMRQVAATQAEAAERALAAAASKGEGEGEGEGWSAFNPLPMPRRAIISLPDGTRLDLGVMGPLEARPIAAVDAKPAPAVRVGDGRVANDRVDAAFDDQGRLSALSIDGAALALAEPAGLRLHTDRPGSFPAWEIDHSASWSGVALPPVRLRAAADGSLRGEAAFGAGSRVGVTVTAGDGWLGYELDVDWHEIGQRLIFALPTECRGRVARFGSAFGFTPRPAVWRSPAEAVQWEVPGQRWAAALRDDLGGWAILTEASYGFTCRDGLLTVSLLRDPDDEPPREHGRHRIRFAIAPYRAAQVDADHPATAVLSDALYQPVVAVPGALRNAPAFELDAGGLIATWAAPGPDGTLRIRLHDDAGAGGSARLRLPRPGALTRVDLLDRPRGAKSASASEHTVGYRPHELISVLVSG